MLEEEIAISSYILLGRITYYTYIEYTYLGGNQETLIRAANQGRTAAFCLGASSCHLQSDNKMSPRNLKANFCTFLSILYKTAGKLVVFLKICWLMSYLY